MRRSPAVRGTATEPLESTLCCPTSERGPVQSRSACLDRPNLHSAFIDRDCRQFAVALGWQTSEVIHDRLPFLDFADSAVSCPYGDAVFIYRTRRRQQVGGVLARVVKCLDPRREGLTRLVLGHQRQQPFVYFGIATAIKPKYRGHERL
jgi:hypothetical protein